jgi:hypothetical protein
MKIGNTAIKNLLNPKPVITIPEKRSSTTDRLICRCGKGYASEDQEGQHYGQCRPCWVNS